MHDDKVLLLTTLAFGLSGACTANESAADAGGDASRPCFEEVSLTVSPTSSLFADTPVGRESAPVRFTALNIGSAALTGVSFVLGGSAPADFVVTGSTCGPPLPFMGECQTSIAFRPTTPGKRSATLKFSALGGAQPWCMEGSFAVILEGQGQPQPLAPDAGEPDAGKPDAGADATGPQG